MSIKVDSKFIASDMTTDLELNALESKIYEVFDIQKEPTGFPNQTDSVVSFDESTRTLSIAPVNQSFDVWHQGKKTTITQTLTKQIPDSSGSYFFFLTKDGVLDYLTTFDTAILNVHAYTAYVYWNSAEQKVISRSEERHGLSLDGITHGYLHTTRGTQLAAGAAITFTTTGTGSSDADAQVSISDMQLRDEDIVAIINNSATPSGRWQQKLFPIAYLPVYYRSGNYWTKDTGTAFPLKTGAQRAYYNKNTNGTWSLQEASANSKYVVSYIFGTTNVSEPVMALMGQDEYTDLADAQARASWSKVNFGDLPAQEMKLLYIVFFETSSIFTNTPKAAVRAVTDLRYGGDREVSAISSATDHGNLSGLNDVDDHPSYLLLSGSRPMSGTLNMNTNAISGVTDLTSSGLATFNKQKSSTVIQVPTYTTSTLNGTLVLTKDSQSLHFINGSAANFSIKLPDSTTVTAGQAFEIYNRSTASIFIKKFSGASLFTLNPESVVKITAQTVLISDGDWVTWSLEVQQASGIANTIRTQNSTFTSATGNVYEKIVDIVNPLTYFEVTPPAGLYAAWFSASATATTNNALIRCALYKGTTLVTGSERTVQGVGSGFNFQMSTLGTVPVTGADTISVQIRASAGTTTVTDRTLLLIRLGGA